MRYLILFFLSGLGLNALADSLFVAPFQGNKKAALSITFDDNLTGQFNHALPILNAAGFKASFFAIAGQRPYSLLQAAASIGHEIGSHSWSHSDLTQANINLTRELRESRDSLYFGLNGLPVSTIAWPLGRGGGSRPAEAIIRDSAKAYFLGARNASVGPSKCEPAATRRYFQIGSVLMDGSISQTGFETNLDTAIKQRGYQVLLYHAIEDPGYAVIPAAIFSQQIAAISQRQDSFWVAPFGSVLKYLRQKNSSSISNIQFNAASGCTNCSLSFDVTVNDTTPVAYTPEPLTLVYKFKNSGIDLTGIDFNNASFSQPNSGNSRLCRWSSVDSTLIMDSVFAGTLQVSFQPNGLKMPIGEKVYLQGNPFGTGIKLINAQSGQNLTWQIVDFFGRVISQKSLPENENFTEDRPFSAGIYTIRVLASELIKSEKFVVLH